MCVEIKAMHAKSRASAKHQVTLLGSAKPVTQKVMRIGEWE